MSITLQRLKECHNSVPSGPFARMNQDSVGFKSCSLSMQVHRAVITCLSCSCERICLLYRFSVYVHEEAMRDEALYKVSENPAIAKCPQKCNLETVNRMPYNWHAKNSGFMAATWREDQLNPYSSTSMEVVSLRVRDRTCYKRHTGAYVAGCSVYIYK